MIIRIGIALISALLITSELHAEWSRAEKSYTFSAEMAEAEACKRAENKARASALGKVTGEHLSSEDLLSCSDRNDDEACTMQRHTWSMIDGDIKEIRNLSRNTTDVGSGFRQCVVSLEADVVVGKGKPDPSFDFGVSLNQKTFRSGEEMSLRLDPTQEMYMNVFQWLPYEKDSNQIIRIFPNQYDPNVRFNASSTIPTTEGKERYSLRVAFPEAYKKAEKYVDEFLMIVGTKKSISFRETYSLQEFKARLLEVPRSEYRQVKKAYTILRSQ